MQQYVATGRVEGGKLRIRDRRAFDVVVGSWRDCEVTVTVEKKHAIRSTDQNAFYWGVVVHLLSEHTGFTPDEMHEYLKTRFIPKRLAVVNGNGEVVDERVIGGTTTTMNKIEFGEYLENIRRWAAEDLGVITPDPDPLWKEHEREGRRRGVA